MSWGHLAWWVSVPGLSALCKPRVSAVATGDRRLVMAVAWGRCATRARPGEGEWVGGRAAGFSPSILSPQKCPDVHHQLTLELCGWQSLQRTRLWLTEVTRHKGFAGPVARDGLDPPKLSGHVPTSHCTQHPRAASEKQVRGPGPYSSPPAPLVEK